MVLPCEPATAMPYFMRISSASISARGMTGIAARARLDHLGVVGLDRARDRRRRRRRRGSRRRGRTRRVAPSCGEAARGVRLLQVGAATPVAEVEQHLGDAAHADAADADEVDARVAACGTSRPATYSARRARSRCRDRGQSLERVGDLRACACAAAERARGRRAMRRDARSRVVEQRRASPRPARPAWSSLDQHAARRRRRPARAR